MGAYFLDDDAKFIEIILWRFRAFVLNEKNIIR